MDRLHSRLPRVHAASPRSLRRGHRALVPLVLGTWIGMLCACSDSQAATLPLAIGDRIRDSGSLRDLRGNQRSLTDFRGYEATVLAFLGTECPLANRYVPRLVELEFTYRKRVKFIGVYSNASDDLIGIAVHGERRGIPFLLTKDIDQKLANLLGVDRTPTVVVLGQDLAVAYRGRIDDRYSVAGAKSGPASDDLVRAIDEVLDGGQVSTPQTATDGCLIERPWFPAQSEPISFTRDVAPILQRRCEACHRPGQIGPFSLVTFEQARRHRSMIREVVEQRRMPPWHADPAYGAFANDRRMPQSEIDTIGAWVASGAQRGDPSDQPPPLEWQREHEIQQPDRIIAIPGEIEVPAEGVLDYFYFDTDPGLQEDVWVRAAELCSDFPELLHHAVVRIVRPEAQVEGAQLALLGDSLLVNWVPGQSARYEPPGAATRIPAGSILHWDIHYTPNGIEARDHVSVALLFAEGRPELETVYRVMPRVDLFIPAGGPHHVERHSFLFEQAAHLVSLRPHMHRRGKSWSYDLEFPDGQLERLLSVPNWDFNWQTEYVLQEPRALPAGTRIHATAAWDNSDNNLSNPDPSQDVVFGRQIYDEMMNGWLKFY